MRQLVVIFTLALVFGALGGSALAQNVKAFKGGGGPTGQKTAINVDGSWVKAYWVKAY